MPKIKWLERATRDLDSIYEYILQDDPKSARKVASAILKNVRILEKHPQIGRAGRVPGTRELIVLKGAYLVAYCCNEEVEILRVLRHSQDWQDIE
ncbi:type II toxin-antitoxin system RelE/ParE family toxin [Desulfovibrio sp. JC010]|uniref:type II toxin-antitoxin system RelE/ParE family toxin n=1 Tax=Desulfovibrio sp. JC010 TaxID=2593641 RepID=UPI0013D0DB03|nr:type II toxin-antitoxin system RelE/ParE family toxin [Desulfovibrio sp. JC010]NDV25747.1 type II toxin-antitoxin system RelE/ParE family toxin [Desulfovibrio sp. JC010]